MDSNPRCSPSDRSLCHWFQMYRAACVLLLLAVLCRAEMFTALVDMEHLAYTERELLGMLDRAIQAEEQKIQMLKK